MRSKAWWWLAAAFALTCLPVLPLFGGPVKAPVKQSHQQQLECGHCHQCAHPTPEAPCLKTYDCPRSLAAAGLSADLGPKIVILDDLQELYVPVRFDHHKHAAMAGMNGGCTGCHHYTPPNFPHPACRECHPASVKREDLAQPGLKGAYHRQCLGCHVEWDSQTKCEVCHAKAKGGGLKGTATAPATSHYHQPMVMKDTIIFETGYKKGDKVPFHHRQHARTYDGDCAMCHQNQTCATCHVHGTEASAHPMGKLADIDLHETCNQCHQGQSCTHCHGRRENDLFDHASTGWPMKVFHSGLHCSSCHGAVGRYGPLDPSCGSCHEGGFGPQFKHAVTGVVLDEVHAPMDCADCHAGGLGAPSTCDSCHDDGRKYTRHASFGPGAARPAPAKNGGGGAGNTAPAPKGGAAGK